MNKSFLVSVKKVDGDIRTFVIVGNDLLSAAAEAEGLLSPGMTLINITPVDSAARNVSADVASARSRE
jgi:hypothetical protein